MKDSATPAKALGEPCTHSAVCADSSPGSPEAELLAAICRIVNQVTGHDFSSYRTSTVERRIARRMAVHEVQGMQDYLALLKESPLEAHALYQEILIGVTAFFRDPEAFEVMRSEVIPRLFAGRDPEQPVRIWHACCATGEEVYSLAILIREYLDEQGLACKVLIFATDLDESAVARARSGFYAEGECTGLGAARLATFFSGVENGYQVSKSLREMIVFARHDLIKDPPFSRLDLLVCRNFLIYITPDMQRRLISLFHRVLRPEGFLFLGSSETLGHHAELFSPVNKKWKIYLRPSGGTPAESSLNFAASFVPRTVPARGIPGSADPESPGESVEKLLRERYSPPCVIVNERYEVVYVSTRSSRFLELPLGEPTRDILKMVREGLRPALRAAIHKALAEQTQVVFRGQRLSDDSGEVTVNVLVEPLGDPHAPRRLAMVVFEPAAPALLPAGSPDSGPDPAPQGELSKDQLIRQLEEQLQIHHDQLQVTIEQLETSNMGLLSNNEELMSINEEFQSTNEELQSTNEELETSKEELQSLNEELVTVNAELHDKVEELARARNDMENFLNSAGIATVFLDPQLQVMRFTPTMARLFNLIPADIGRPFRHVSGRFDWGVIAHDVAKVLSGEAGAEREVTDQESGRRYLLRILPYLAAAGGTEGVVLTLIDITESKLAEQSLVESEMRFRYLFEHLQDGFAYCQMLYDETGAPADFVYLSVNGAFVQLTGLEDVVGRKVSEVIPGFREAAPELLEIYGRVARTGCSERFEIDFKPLGWLSISAYSPERGYFVAVFENIAERKHAEQRLLEYRKIIECTRDMVYVLDRDYRYLLANEAYLECWGFEGGDLRGRSLAEVLGPETFAECLPYLEQCLAHQQVSFEARFEYPGRGARDISITYSPIEDHGVVDRIACVVKDITEQKQLQERLRQSQKMEAIGTLAGGIAHDFNNILTVISGYACLIQLSDEEKGEAATMAGEILTSVERAAEMTRGLLAFSRKQQVNLSPLDLNSVVAGLNKSLSRLINEDIEVSVRLAQAPLYAMADKGQLEQVLINLAVNARDAMPGGGSLLIATEEIALGAEEAELLGSAPGNYGMITVSDNGVGINDKIQQRVFEPFFTTKEVGKGTGLGLSMGYGIVKKHNGIIKMQSEPGVGTTFRIYLPLCRPQTEEDAGRGECERITGSETILLVEDDEAIRTMIRRLLEQRGYRVLTAGNGEDALRVFREHQSLIQLLITDVIMPRMNGRELQQQICTLHPHLPTIFMSGYPADVMTQKGFSEQSVNYLSKPINCEDLFAKIRDVLGSPAPGALI